MPVNDTISDMLTRVRNAGLARHKQVTMPNTKMTEAIATILKEEGFIRDYTILAAEPQPKLQLDLKYTNERHPRLVITGLRRVSKPGRRIYTRHADIPWVRSGLGIAIISTPRGVITDRTARHLGVGGEVLCYVW